MKNLLLLSLIGSFLVILVGCGNDDGVRDTTDGFDRASMLANWADNIIIPAYEAYSQELAALKSSAETFANTPTVSNLQSLRDDWFIAYTSWQNVSMFEIGKAEEVTLRNYTNVFPVNVSDMEETIASGSYNLESVNKQDEQGFPALDYMIHGLAATDELIADVYLQETTGSNHDDYLVALVDRLNDLTDEVLDDWNSGYRDTFVENSGSDATSSVNKMVNDLIFYYEKHLRAGKIGIPAGVFSGAPLSDRVESLYGGNSKALFNAALNSFQNFFNGRHFNTGTAGESLQSYLVFLNIIREGEDLAQLINNQFDQVRTTANGLSDDFDEQVNTDNTLMLNTYDALQVNVVFMKVDMLQAMSIKVDFVDADGD